MLFVCKHETQYETKQVAGFTDAVNAAPVMDAQKKEKKKQKNL